ncbi:MAG: hypothetical protein MUO76_10660 [Anaerolineaceae bacterium]|nr:hypothetical protein [Anaerolineaceae bacterium]
MSNIFEVVDPQGRTIYCTEDQWAQHVLSRRSWMRNKENVVAKAVENPKFICQDVDEEDRQIYYYFPYSKNNLYMKVVVRFNKEDLGEVITAFPTDSCKPGEKVLWMP